MRSLVEVYWDTPYRLLTQPTRLALHGTLTVSVNLVEHHVTASVEMVEI